MRIIVEAFSRAYAMELSFARIRVANASEILTPVAEPTEDSEEKLAYDPHSTTGGSFERRSGMEDIYGIANRTRTKYRFGFTNGDKEARS